MVKAIDLGMLHDDPLIGYLGRALRGDNEICRTH
jgi:hypothetical protein